MVTTAKNFNSVLISVTPVDKCGRFLFVHPVPVSADETRQIKLSLVFTGCVRSPCHMCVVSSGLSAVNRFDHWTDQPHQQKHETSNANPVKSSFSCFN